VLGWICGALVNYLSDVLPWKRRLAAPVCVHCNLDAYQQAEQAGQAEDFRVLETAFGWVNYLLWPRRCPVCSRTRLLRTWIVEAVYIGLALWFWNNPQEQLGFWAAYLWLVYFGVVVVIDLEYRIILNPVSLVGALAGLVTGIYLRGLPETLLGGAVGYGVMLALYWLAGVFIKIADRMRGKPVNDEALGFGDVNLSGVLGLFLGYPGIAGGLILAIFLGGGISLLYLLIMLALRRYKLFTALPYGPYLVAGAVVMAFFRELIFGG